MDGWDWDNIHVTQGEWWLLLIALKQVASGLVHIIGVQVPCNHVAGIHQSEEQAQIRVPQVSGNAMVAYLVTDCTPRTAVCSTASKRRNQSFLVPSAARVTNTSELPSGETAISAVPRGNFVPAGG